MLLVLWTLYSVSALAFRAVSTKSCGILFVFGPNLQFWNCEERANRANVFPVFSGLVITVCLNIWGFFVFLVFFVYVGLKFVIIIIFFFFFEFLKSGQAGQTFALFSRISYNDLPEYYCTRYELESIMVHAVSCGCWGFRTCFCRGQSRIFQVKRRLREAIVYFGGLQLSTQAKK